MSGVVGILNPDGRPVDRDLLEAMTSSLAFRGPEAQRTWMDGCVGFGHTLLRTTFEAKNETQPHTLDGETWITADARIDARADLVRELDLPQSALNRPDCKLILHAYARWGESCVKHLLGDFAFAIWDAPARKLFCARDHFGVKPFYYADLGHTFVFSNTLAAVRLHQGVSDELNELAIADFLIFDCNQDLSTTTFSDIHRLPPAHSLVVEEGEVSVGRYWSLPEGERIRYRRSRDYVEHFCALLESATADRLRTDHVGISMSGGLDSPSVAAFARRARPATRIHAYTVVYDSLIPDDERHFAGMVADYLRVPVHFIVGDDVRPFASGLSFGSPEPLHDPFRGFSGEYLRRIAAETPVVLTGYGADPLLSVSPLLNWKSVREIPKFDTLVTVLRYVQEFRAIPGLRLRSTLRALCGAKLLPAIELPDWLDPEFVRRLDLRSRVTAQSAELRKDDLRPIARRSLRSVFWPWHFEVDDVAWSGTLLDWRHPYLDCRLVHFLMAIPELPYSMDKYLLRISLREMLPEQVRTRPKTPLRADPLEAACGRRGITVELPAKPNERLSRYVNVKSVPALTSTCSAERLWIDTRPYSLNQWLVQFQEENITQCKPMIANRFAPPIVHPN